MNIYGLRILTDHPEVTTIKLDTGASFRLADKYTDPDSQGRMGLVVNATQNANIGVARQVIGINKPRNDNSLNSLNIAVLTNQTTIKGKVTFGPQKSQGTVTIKIGNSAKNCDLFTTNADDEDYFTLTVDKSWGRPQNAEE